MTPVPLTADRSEAPLFTDGFGERVLSRDGATGEPLQILRLRPSLTAVPSFEFALRERSARLANFRHSYYSRVRRIDRAMNPTPSLAVVSDHVEGVRLSEILRIAGEKHLHLDVNAALCLIRQLVPAVALLHENARDVAHGILAPERLIVTPHARLIIVEHVLGAAVEQLRWGRERLWREFRVAMPLSAGVPRFDHRADVIGIGAVALALVLGRPLEEHEFPHAVPDLLESARERSAAGDDQPLSSGLRTWLARALQVDPRRAFASAPEAHAALEEVVAEDSMYVAAPVALETFLSRYIASLAEPVPAPAAIPAPAPVPAAARVQISPVAALPLEMPALHLGEEAEALEPQPLSTARGAAPETAAMPGVPPIIDDAPELGELVDLTGLDEPEVEERDQPRPLFEAEEPLSPPSALAQASAPQKPRRNARRLLVAAASMVVLATVGAASYAGYVFYSAGRAPAMGTLVVQSSPAGVQVFVDGVDRGVTPARLTLAPGAHILELRGRGVPRVIPLTLTAGAEVSQHLEFAEAAVVGQLAVQSDPPGARVFVDGTERGVAPLTVHDLAPGEHEVVLQSAAGSGRHVVIVQAGAVASLVAPMTAAAPAGPVSGWVSVSAPFTVEIREQGQLLGTTDTNRLMLAAGKHELEFVNASLGLRIGRTVQVTPGKVTSLSLELPRGIVHLNATPWAEVWIDGQRAGETPLGNVSLPIGPHEVVFKNPQFGEKRHAIAVTAGAPVRVSVDMK